MQNGQVSTLLLGLGVQNTYCTNWTASSVILQKNIFVFISFCKGYLGLLNAKVKQPDGPTDFKNYY